MNELSNLAKQVDEILKEELASEGIGHDFAEARVYNAKTVGVQGDERSYAYPAEIELRNDGQIVWNPEFLARLNTRITNDVRGINRVAYVIASKKDYLSQLISDFKLPADADIHLDSLKWQAEQAGKTALEVQKDLRHLASIASFYADPIAALKKLDKAFAEYVRRSRNPNYRKVSLEKLHRADYAIAQRVKRPLNLDGLDDRIEQYLFGVDGERGKPGIVRGSVGSPDPGFENAVRRLES